MVAEDAARVQELWANPDRVAASDLVWLEELVAAYPAAVPLWWLYVRAVQRAESPNFAQVLQRCAAISPDRSALLSWVEEPLTRQAEVAKPEPKVAKPEPKVVKPETEPMVAKPEPKVVKPEKEPKVAKPEPQAEVAKLEPQAEVAKLEPQAEVPQSDPTLPKEIDLDSLPEKVRAQILRSRAIMVNIKGEEPTTVAAPAPALAPEPQAEVAKPKLQAEVAKPKLQAEIAKPEPHGEIAKPEPQAKVAKPEPKTEVAQTEPKVEKPEPRVAKPEPQAEVAKPEPKAEVPQSAPAQPKEIDLDSLPEKVRAQILRSRAIMAKIKGEEPTTAAAPALAPAVKSAPEPLAPALVQPDAPESPVVAEPLTRQTALPKTKPAAKAKHEVGPKPSIAAEAVPSAAEGLSPFAQFVTRLSNAAAAGPKAEDLIDEFLSTNPRISPLDKRDKDAVAPVVQSESSELVTGLVTETLARLYAEQGHAAKAIQAYEILKLRVPEKSLIFAARIEALRNQ